MPRGGGEDGEGDICEMICDSQYQEVGHKETNNGNSTGTTTVREIQ